MRGCASPSPGRLGAAVRGTAARVAAEDDATLRAPDATAIRRQLNEIEYFTWCFGQPYNIVATVLISGGLQVDRLRDALDEAQRRHPLLGVNTELGSDGVPWFTSRGVGRIPLTVIDDAPPAMASQLEARELGAPFEMDGGLVPGHREGDGFKGGALFTSPRAAGRGRRPRAAGRGERRSDEGCPSPLSSPRFRGARTNGLQGAEIGSKSNAQQICCEVPAARLPLIRASLLLPRDPALPATLMFTAHHVIADGLSLAFLVRDLLQMMEHPDAPVQVLGAPASPEDLLPARARRRISRSSRPFRLLLALVRAYAWLRFGGRLPAPRAHAQRRLSWQLTAEQTSRLRGRCHHEGVSVQAALCTALLPAFPAIHTPVNLRQLLARPVGESLGLFVGAANVAMKYRPTRGFWWNARRYQRRLRRALRDPFRIYRLFSKAVPAAELRQFLSLLMTVGAHRRPFALSNLGELDGNGLELGGRRFEVESFSGAVTGLFGASALTVHTIRGCMHLDLLANEPAPSGTAVGDDAERAIQRLLEAMAD